MKRFFQAICFVYLVLPLSTSASDLTNPFVGTDYETHVVSTFNFSQGVGAILQPDAEGVSRVILHQGGNFIDFCTISPAFENDALQNYNINILDAITLQGDQMLTLLDALTDAFGA